MSPSSAPWWASAVIYQLYVRSFADGNGDGRGDLLGIRQRLSELADLGVDGIWLNPCYPSPQWDHGYDVANFFDIEPAYGDLATFDVLVAEAKALGLKLMMDIVPNHCSIDHAWFREAVAAGPGSAARERFWFRDGRGLDGAEPPNNWISAFTGPAWTRIVGPDGVPEQWYMNTFASQQPDWNWNHPDVIDHYDRVLRFWLDRGVDGFRVDAPTPVGKHPELPDAPPPPVGVADVDVRRFNEYANFRDEGHVVWKHWRTVLDDYEREHPGFHTVMVAETYSPKRPDLIAKFVRPDEYHQAFAFELMLAPWHPAAMRDAIDEVMSARAISPWAAAWTLNNHDAQRSVTRYGRADAADPTRFATSALTASKAPVDLAMGTRRHRAALLMMLALPGGVYVYQGEELGLPEVLDLPADAREDPMFIRSGGAELGRDGCRVPLPWTVDGAGNHGFSAGASPAAAWLPQPADWGRYGRDAQRDDPASMLSFYREALGARRKLGFADAAFSWIDDGSLVAFRRERLVVVANMAADARPLPLDARGRSVALESVPNATDGTTIAADAAVWLA